MTNVERPFNATKASQVEDAALINISTAVACINPVPGYDSYASSKLAAAKFFEFVQAENPSILYSIGLKLGLIPKQFLVSRIDNYAM